jgi:GTP-binding protein Era
MNNQFRSGFVSIIGKPNVGKSTLLNKILQEKISIVTPKPQTTRHQIKGIFTDDEKQIIFIDTPGFLKPRYELQTKMLDYIKMSLADSDCLLFIADVTTFPSDYDRELLSFIEPLKLPKIAIVNKIDLVEQEIALSLMEQLKKLGFDDVIPISALLMENGNEVISRIAKFLPLNPPFYNQDEVSDLPMRFFVQETIREQIFLLYQQEVPYSSTVMVEMYNELDNKIEIAANIWIERKSQKPIILGEKGEKIKQLRQISEREIYRFAGKRIRLDLWVKIKPNWRNKKNSLKEFGYY